MRILLAIATLCLLGLAAAPTASALAECQGVTAKGKFTGECSNDPTCPSASGGYGTAVYVNGAWFACIDRVDLGPGPLAAGCYGVTLASQFTGVCTQDPACRGPDGTAGIGIYQKGTRTGCIYS